MPELANLLKTWWLANRVDPATPSHSRLRHAKNSFLSAPEQAPAPAAVAASAKWRIWKLMGHENMSSVK